MVEIGNWFAITFGGSSTPDRIAFTGEPYYVSEPVYRSVPYGEVGWLSGTVQRVDRHLGYLSVRDDASGALVKIDVRHMNLRHPVNIWGTRAGDHISVNGAWENRDTFDARLVQY